MTPAKLTWRGVPREQPDGAWAEVWQGTAGRQLLFEAFPRKCEGRGSTYELYDVQALPTGAPGDFCGQFLNLSGAQARAKRLLRG